MARLGIDFGTTNTVAAVYDRGMFCVVNHRVASSAGTVIQEVFSSSILIEPDGRRWHGPEAERRFAQVGAASGCVFVGSLKRRLRDYAEGRKPGGDAGSGDFDIADLLAGFLKAANESIRRSLTIADGEPLETVITWPANANGAQRYITRRCFRDAGFEVIDTLQEPTASAIELADCLTAGRKSAPAAGLSTVAVFDLGGGTFDAAVVGIDGAEFNVLASTGIEHLGGDDLDEALLSMFLGKLGIDEKNLASLTRYALLRQVRAQKETISTGAVRSLFLNPADYGLAGRPLSIPVAAYYERVRPMLAPAVAKLGEVVGQAGKAWPGVKDGPSLLIYLVGGSSKLPLVADMVTAAFPASRVVLTDKPFRSVAMGAAICAMDRVRFRDVVARHFGLIRLRDHGQAETFDTIFASGTPIPRRSEPPLERAAWYHPKHNIGHLRYLECASVGHDGMPAEGVRTWSDILFPYDPAVPLSATVCRDTIVTTDAFSASAVCEVYRCDADGVITVELRRPACNDVRCYEIYKD